MIWFSSQVMQNVLLTMTVIASLLSFFSAAFMWRLRATFVTKTEIGAAFAEVKAENTTAFDALKLAISGIDGRTREVEIDGSSLAAEIRGVREVSNRIDHLVGLLVEHRLRESEQRGQG